VDDGRRRLTVRRETVEDVLELVDRAQVEPHQVAVLTRDPVALADLGRLGGDLADSLELSGGRPDANDGGNREAESRGVELRAVGARTLRNGVALGLAVVGVYLLTDVELEGEPIGVAFAFANAALFATYIVLAHRLSRIPGVSRLDGLAAAMLVAAVFATPLAGWSAAPALVDPVALAAGVGVGISSSVVPYVFDQLAMARLARATYSLMVSILPATATVIGIVVLGQVPTWIEVGGVVLVVSAVALHRERPKTPSNSLLQGRARQASPLRR